MTRHTTAALRRALVAIAACASPAPNASAADAQLLVHGYGDSGTGKDCNGDTFKNALAYYEDAGGRSRSSMSTIGFAGNSAVRRPLW
jgi:hypothetical protein